MDEADFATPRNPPSQPILRPIFVNLQATLAAEAAKLACEGTALASRATALAATLDVEAAAALASVRELTVTIPAAGGLVSTNLTVSSEEAARALAGDLAVEAATLRTAALADARAAAAADEAAAAADAAAAASEALRVDIARARAARAQAAVSQAQRADEARAFYDGVTNSIETICGSD